MFPDTEFSLLFHFSVKHLLNYRAKGQNPNNCNKMIFSLSANRGKCRPFLLRSVVCKGKKKNIQTVKISLLTCLKITGHELPVEALSLIFNLHWDHSAATWSAVIQSVIVWSDWDFFTVFLHAPLSVSSHWSILNL